MAMPAAPRRWERRRAAGAFRRRPGRHLALPRQRACPRAGRVRASHHASSLVPSATCRDSRSLPRPYRFCAEATTPEGKDYYYKESTGETSWSPPSA